MQNDRPIGGVAAHAWNIALMWFLPCDAMPLLCVCLWVCLPHSGIDIVVLHTHVMTRSSAIAAGQRDVLVSTNPSTTKHPIWKWLQLTNDLEVYTPKVTIIAAFIYAGHITRPVSGLLLQCLYLAPFLRYYHFRSERDWQWPGKLLHFWQQKIKLQATCTF